jgi:hypothetical protein
MTRLRTIAMCVAMAVLVLSACASSAVAVEFTTSYTDGASWNAIYAQGFKASINPSPDPLHAPTDTVYLDRFDFVKAGLIDGAVEAANVRLAIVNSFWVNLDTLTTTSAELVGLSTNTIADTTAIATGDPIRFNFDGVAMTYGDPEEWGADSYAAIFVNVDELGAMTPVKVPAMVADYVENPVGSGIWMPESDYGDATGDYTLAVSNYITVNEYGSWLTTWETYYADASFVATFDMEGLAGDYNGDGSVDAADYTVWRDGLGTTYVESDYDVWKANFGATAGGGAVLATAAVPEPGAVVLIGIAAVAAWRSCRRRKAAVGL